MSTVDYIDEDGSFGTLEDIYKVNRFDLINGTNKREAILCDAVNQMGGVVINVTTQTIGKRRYKRKLAKLAKRKNR